MSIVCTAVIPSFFLCTGFDYIFVNFDGFVEGVVCFGLPLYFSFSVFQSVNMYDEEGLESRLVSLQFSGYDEEILLDHS